ncbi:MAG TPA: HEAT repeat domain-containing protein [Chloroflexia bacterium]|jgi:uncharacterized protein YuzB (UPF0349 family)
MDDMYKYLYITASGGPWTKAQEEVKLEVRNIDVSNMTEYDLLGNYDVEQLRLILERSSNIKFRTMAITNLGKAGGKSQSVSITQAAIEILEKTKNDPSYEVRAYTCAALCECVIWSSMFGVEGQVLRTNVKRSLAEMMEDPHPFVREQAEAEYRILNSG